MERVPNGISAAYAALTKLIAVGLHAVRKSQPKGNKSILVAGCRPVGLAVIACFQFIDAVPVIAADYSPKRRTLAKKWVQIRSSIRPPKTLTKVIY